MSKEVKRYCLSEFAEPHTYPIGPGAHVLAIDYEALEAERDALLAERDALKKDAERYRLFAATTVAEFSGADKTPNQSVLFSAMNSVEQVSSVAELDAIFDHAMQGEQP